MDLSKGEIIELLGEKDPEKIEHLFNEAFLVKKSRIGEKVYLRGLIEISNICSKNCLYCGIRAANHEVNRYTLNEEEILEAAMFAYKERYGSIVIQGGERKDKAFTELITQLLRKIKKLSDNNLGITLSLGEQDLETYQEWYAAGAHRYLLRIETTNRELYNKIHPNDADHSYTQRLDSIALLRRAGYQVGTGVMIGLPFQTNEDLAGDLLFFKEQDIDMIGMGPYLEHRQTPLYQYKEELLPKQERLTLTFKMISILRLMMPDINIAATTAMQTIDPFAREKAVNAGANVIMPNMTLSRVRKDYQIYENKPGVKDDADITKTKLEHNLAQMGIPIGWNEWGDSIHFNKRKR